MAEPVLVVAAEAAEAGIPELLLVVAAVEVAKQHMFSQACPTEPEPTTLSRGAAETIRAA